MAILAWSSMFAAGATATGAMAAVGAAFLGSLLGAALNSAITGNWSNFWDNAEFEDWATSWGY